MFNRDSAHAVSHSIGVSIVNYGNSHSIVKIPATTEPLVQSRIGKPLDPSPFCDGFLATFKFYEVVTTFVVVLSHTASPSTIFRRVWSIIVDAIKFMARRTWPHIFEKSEKAIVPSVTDSNPSEAVIFSLFRTLTSRFSMRPRGIFTRVNESVSDSFVHSLSIQHYGAKA